MRTRVARLEADLAGDFFRLHCDAHGCGWCQAGPRDRLAKLVSEYELSPDGDTWALSCFLIAPDQRGKGLTGQLLAEVVADLRGRGVRRLEAYPRRVEGLDPLDLWTGPESVYRAAGFRVARDEASRPVLALEL